MSLSFRHCFTRKTTLGPAAHMPGIGRYKLIRSPGQTPYFASLDTPLLAFGKDLWTNRDACESLSCLGGIGSAKTTTTMRSVLRAYLRAGWGGAYFCMKTDAADELRIAAREVGRTHDIVTFDGSPDSARLNVLDIASQQFGGATAASGAVFGTSLIGLMSVVIEAGRRASGTGGGGEGENRFFTEGALKDTAGCFPVLQWVYGTIRMKDAYAFLASVPQTAEEAKSAEWMQQSFCGRTLGLLADRIKEADAQGSPIADALKTVWHDHAEYFLGEVARLHSKTKTSITATFTNTIYHFLTGELNRLLCTDTTVHPQDARRGKILLVDLSPLKYGAGASIAAVIIKYLCSLSWQSEPPTPTLRPVFIFADEAQAFLDSTDADTLATGRSVRISTVYASQDLPTYYAKLGKSGRDVADSILAKFGTRVFHANTCTVTNEAAANMIGKVEKFHRTETRSTGQTTGTGGNRHDASGGYHGNHGANQSRGESTSGYMDFDFAPSAFATLRTGGPRNKGLADAVIIRNGRKFKATGKHWMLAELEQ
jgi:hypothetical protein